jgi:TPR repeat protein
MNRFVSFGILGGLVLSANGCGHSSVAETVRPKAATASEALGEPTQNSDGICRDVTEGGRPLVVDWKPEQRGDLEVAMSQGIAVLAYDCKKMELLPDCTVEGSYGFKGVVLKQQVIRLQDEDEIRANLPLNGIALAAQLKADLERGATVDLATALVGNMTGSKLTVGRTELKGRCQGATHFVRGANIGAFVMQGGEKAQVASAATLFGAGTSAGSKSSRFSRVEDGNVESCKEASADSPAPPRNCGALVRVHLLPISTEATSSTVAPDVAANSMKFETTCPSGMVLQDGKCAKPEVVAAHECRGDDVVDCQTQCDKNQAASCARLAKLISKGKAGNVDSTKTAQLFDKACRSDQGDACSDLGIQYMTGKGVPTQPEQAMKLFEKACQLGEANGCFNLGNLYYDGQGAPKDRAKAFGLFQQACNAGKPAGCINVGNMYDDGDGVIADSSKAFNVFKKACEGDAAVGCTNLAYMYAEGKSIPKDQTMALKLYEKACNLANARGCEYAGLRYRNGEGVPVDLEKGQSYFKRACELGTTSACSGASQPSAK